VILPDAAVGSIVAAAIAGLVVFISTVLTKEQKTSEFRQVWIDEIRKDIAQYIAGVSEIVAIHGFKVGDNDAYKKFLDDNFKMIHELQTIEHRIFLRLNPNEHQALVEQVKNFRKNMLQAHQQANRGEREEQLTKQLLDATKEVLSFEWKRVKAGEPTFRRVKWGAFITLVCLLIALVLALFETQPKMEEKVPTTQQPNQILQYFAAPGAPRTNERMLQPKTHSLAVPSTPTKDCTSSLKQAENK
jgi:hypothetical protein